MKRNFIYLFLWFAVASVTSCSKGDDFSSPAVNPVVVSSEVLNPLLIDAAKTELNDTDAAQVMKLFLCRENPDKKTRASFVDKAVESTFPIEGDGGEPLAYVVNYAGGGYGIVSATKKYAPILAFSDEGRITPASLEGNGLALWVASITADIAETKSTLTEDSPEYAEMRMQWREYEKPEAAAVFSATMQDANYWYQQLRDLLMYQCGDCTRNRRDFYAKAQNYGHYFGNADAMEAQYKELDRVLEIQYAGTFAPPSFVWGEGISSDGNVKIMPLLKTYWDQGDPYNRLIEMRDSGPNGGETRKPAGCVAIAVAQIMNYYRYPAVLYLPVGFSDPLASIDWSKTQEKFASETNTEIPTLVKAVNIGVLTRNGDEGSSSTIDNAQSFLNYNGYTALIHSGSTIDRILKNEVIQQRLVYVQGFDSNGDGHAWVCDGYYARTEQRKLMAYEITNTQNINFPENPYRLVIDKAKVFSWDEFLHMNWGWGGFKMDEQDPSDLSGNSVGWFRSVFDAKYNDNVRILQIIR